MSFYCFLVQKVHHRRTATIWDTPHYHDTILIVKYTTTFLTSEKYLTLGAILFSLLSSSLPSLLSLPPVNTPR